MQTLKFLSVIGAAMIFSVPSVNAAKPETEAQAKMREAMRMKMEELKVQETPPVAVPVETPKAPEPAPPAKIQKPETKPAPALKPVPAPKPAPAPKPTPVAKPEVKPVAPKPVEAKAEPVKPKPAPAPVAVKAPVAAPTKAEFSDPVVEAESANAARLAEALQKKMAELNVTTPAVTVRSAPVKSSAKPLVVVTPAPTKMEAPASPLPLNKQDRLAELLRRYKADELNAQDYHSKRAAILAE